ncbi:chemotaxis protein MotC [Rhizobium halophytocola]|uniref:Chemotaxis protein MotC n=1 Tax=Rhizobium halophytocola TaxID=735519 RepID=A0ABS4E5E4_9HYPH|nr:chemotaxis protein MotC [Rhizobium halophytocola]MBP1853131.1 chemotaxis protein MotC [Rhizobium halophytocola]
MRSRRLLYLPLLVAALSGTAPPLAAAPAAAPVDDIELAPYKMLRSLQFVQDAVVLGDHSAGEMQRFILGTLDDRLRSADASVFEDPRNVDAAFIYAMSGGNPKTLDLLLSRDVDGNFDSRIADLLGRYLSGKGTLVAKSLGELATEYRQTKIAPYLSLVAANVLIGRDLDKALKFYDWARLLSPGTLVEEAALRRSLAVTVEADRSADALKYASLYVRRFLHSPYASQFADLFVTLIVKHFDDLDHQRVLDTLTFMDVERRREVYLRVARQAAIDGKNELARLAADNAKALAGTADDNEGALADLYGGMANIPTEDVAAVMQRIASIPPEMLTPSDRALRSAAEAIAREVLRSPEPKSSAQGDALSNDTSGQGASVSEADVSAGQPGQQDPSAPSEPSKPSPVQEAQAPVAAALKQDDPAFSAFVEQGRSRLEAIDGLLDEEPNP